MFANDTGTKGIQRVPLTFFFNNTQMSDYIKLRG